MKVVFPDNESKQNELEDWVDEYKYLKNQLKELEQSIEEFAGCSIGELQIDD